MKKATIILFVGISIWAAGPAADTSNSAGTLRMQALITPNGDGRLFVNHGAAPWTWEACAADHSGCTPFGRGREIKTKAAPAGTVFRVESHGAVGFSPEWRGRLVALGDPITFGPIRANEFVSPVPGSWRGGWKGEYSEMQLAACVTIAAVDCVTLTHPHYVRSCAADASFVLDEKFVGRYLRVADRRVGAGRLTRPAFGVTSPYGGEIWKKQRDTSVAMVGQIAAPLQTYPGECGPPPPGRAELDEQGRALVDCQGGCQATLVASRKGRELEVSRTLLARSALLVSPPIELRLANRIVRARLGTGKIRFAVHVNGKTAAQRLVLIN